MATLRNNNSGARHDGQKNYQGSNQRNPDNVRNATQKHHYENQEELTNDANFDVDSQKVKGDLSFDDKGENVSKNNNE